MNLESDVNIVYGGDPTELGPIDGNCGSLGELIISDLKKGGNRTSFVSFIETILLTYQLIFGY